MNSKPIGQMERKAASSNPAPRFDLLNRIQKQQVAGRWVIVSYDGEIDDRSASDTEDGAWELFLERCLTSKESFIKDGWHAIKAP